VKRTINKDRIKFAHIVVSY